MIYTERAILRRIRKLSHNDSVRILTIRGCLVNPETGETIDCTNDYGHELSANINSLVKNGYLESLEEYKVALTLKGMHPYAHCWEDIKHFLFHSIAVPIVVSATTSLAVLWLQALLK